LQVCDYKNLVTVHLADLETEFFTASSNLS